uniref:Uncharacterized protein n=1 Tax=Oryza meridionalis TaxID=40149 RepID=A0A0E0FE83_9ORYZ
MSSRLCQGNRRVDTAYQPATRQRSCQVGTVGEQMAIDHVIDRSEQDIGRAPRRGGRKVTINTKLVKKRARRERLDISFPQPFGKVCGKHAKLFKSEVTVIVRNHVPLKAKKWKTIEKQHPGTMANVWKKLKDAFPELRNEDEDCAMKQVEEQYTNRRSRLHCLHRNKKPRPTHVSPEDWAWLIKHSELNEAAQSQQEKICSAAVPLVEHFALVLGRKANHSRGMGLRAINGVAEERLRLLAQVEAAEKHAAAAQERADAAEQRAVAMEDQVRKLDETNAQLQVEQQSQRDELNSQRRTVEGQATDVERMVQQKLDEQMAIYFSRFASSNGPLECMKLISIRMHEVDLQKSISSS